MNKIFLSLLLVSIAITLHAQDPAFTQYHSSPLYLNPAFAGSAGCSRGVTSYRNQWPNLTGNIVTTYVSYDQYVHPIRGGIGLNFLRDNAGNGKLITNRVGLIYSPNLIIKSKRTFTIKPALEFTYFQKSLDWEQFNFGDQIAPQRGFIYQTNENIGESSINAIDLSSGLLIYSKNIYGGIAVHHFIEPNEGFLSASKLPFKTTVHLGYTFSKNDSSKFSLSPSIIYLQQRDFMQLNTTLSFNYKWLLWGIGYRNKDAFVVMLGFQHKIFRMGYSYDYTVSKLSNQNTFGSHEISLSVLFNCKNKKDKISTTNVLAF